MKKKILLLFSVFNSFLLFSQTIYENPQVDERVELMSIVFRLAEADEYVLNAIPLYVSEIDKYFGKYKNHSLINYTKTLRNEYGIGYDAVAGFSIFLEIKNKKIKLRQDINLTQLDERWNTDSIPKYIALLNDFYKKTKFNKFFIKNKEIRETAEANFIKEVTDKVDFDWFKNFFGYLPEKKIRIIVSLANGWHNYGPKIIYNDGQEEYYAIIGSCNENAQGFPIYDVPFIDTKETLIHEINHSFCNSLIDEYLDKLMSSAIFFYKQNEKIFKSDGYGRAESFLYEILTRATVIQYVDKHEKGRYEYEVAKERNAGFLWMPQLVEALKQYEINIENYAGLRGFMPEIVKLQDSLNPQQLYNDIELHKPEILGTNITNNDDSVDYNLDHINIYFDRPMLIGNNGSTAGKYNFPELLMSNWKSAQEWVMYVKLKPDTWYSIIFPYQYFITPNGYYSPKNTYTLNFKTRK
ncbi:MAG: DUF4932 domain-containing protein [Prevotellaceae bacterium]|jgi:hypothetical protein|nr:DUF4932 domain-containing protein [Prevotellaceae bacterium]